MSEVKKISLLKKYFKLGWLERRYYDGQRYCQRYRAEERLLGGEMLYADFLAWRKGTRLVVDYDLIKVDVSFGCAKNIGIGFCCERFRKAVSHISKSYLPVVYQIVLDEEEIKWPVELSARDRIHFNEEIKGLLCRGLDEVCDYYGLRKYG